MTLYNKNSMRKWMRQLHRDIGILMIGVALVYGISGILLNHMNGKNPSYSTIEEQVQLPADLDKPMLKKKWSEQNGVPQINQIAKVDETHIRLLFNGGIGIYNTKSGLLEYEFHKRKPVAYYVNKLHYSHVKGWTVMADVFAGSLIFLALSGILMLPLKGSKGVKRVLLLIIGILIPIVYITLS